MITKADPYGNNIPSNIPRPSLGVFTEVPSPKIPDYPAYLKPIPINTRDIENVMRSYLDKNEPKIQRWLYSTWTAEADAIKYQELRNAVRDKEIQLEWIRRYQEDYSKFVTDVLEPAWKDAMKSAGGYMGDRIEKYAGRGFAYTNTGRNIEEWIKLRGGELQKGLSDAQRKAMKAIIRRYTVDLPLSPQDLGRVLRPIVGLTEKQALAVAKYRDALIGEGMDVKKVDNLVGNYAGFLHRQRALRIARTELSTSYNFGQLESIRQARDGGYFKGEVIKRWLTARDERVCSFCGALNGEIVGLEETYPVAMVDVENSLAPPAHPSCRCTLIYEVLERE